MIPPCLTLSIIRYVSRVKWSNPGKGVAPSPTPRCSNYWKGCFRVALDYGSQLYLLIMQYMRRICNNIIVNMCCILSFVFMNNEEHVYIKIYKNISLILFSKGAHSLLLVWEIDVVTYIQRGDFFLSHIFFQEPVGANACTPLQAVSSKTSETPLIGCLSLARLSILCTLSKSDRVVLISRRLLAVTHLLDRLSVY